MTWRGAVVVTDKMVEWFRANVGRTIFPEEVRRGLTAALSPSADAAKDDAGRADPAVTAPSPAGARVSGPGTITPADNLATLARAAADEWQKSYGTTDRDVAAWRALADQHEANERRLAQMERFLDAIAQGNGDAIRKHNERIAALETAFAALQHKLDAVAEAAATWRAAKTWEKNSDPIIDALAALGGE